MRSHSGDPSGVPILGVIERREVRVVYQPVVDLVTKHIFAFEALARSSSPAFDGPLELFAAAVTHACTGELGRVLRDLAIEGCPDVPLFVNVHPNELDQKWLIQPTDPIFGHSADIYLEITESVPLSHFARCRSILEEVRGRGIHLVVDDLGAGYSNLKYIADLHPKIVKLDRELIAGMVSGSRQFKLVAGLVVLCGDLGAMVVAEGIETAEELEAVVAAGVRYGQGYLLARPEFPPPSIVWPGYPPEAVRRKPRRTLPRR